MVQTTELVLTFTVHATSQNINMLKQLAKSSMIEEDPDDIELGDEIPVEFTLEGEFTEYALNMAMLFNSSLKTKPFIRIVRGGKGDLDEVFKSF